VNKFSKAPPTGFNNSSVTLAKDVVMMWKNAVKVQTAAPSSAEKKVSIDVSLTNTTRPGATASASTTPHTPTGPLCVLTPEQAGQIAGFAEGRRLIVKALQESIYKHVAETDSSTGGEASGEGPSLQTVSVQASIFRVAFDVEAEINDLFPYATNSKAYISKSKTLTVNLKRNEELAMAVMSGHLSPAGLCKLSIEQLATREDQEAQQAILQRKFDAGRTDYYDDVLRDQVMKANGLDPNAAGEFTCRKCKGTKTSHYAMQTRSSDEPMTVFVKCLGCNARWRC
jgi:DNA-directed RNA polymerase subunit M/transcription elongation factor TFIIS